MKIVKILLFSAGTVAFSGVSAVLTGRVVDVDGEGLPGVAAQLISVSDSTQAGYVMTEIDGTYFFHALKTGRYDLTLSMTGMDPVNKLVEIAESGDTIELGTVRMTDNAELLDELVVKGVKAAVIAKQDTLEFNAGSFHTNPNASVEDLLKKLPGVEVGSDGSVTSGGKTVSKILVDGKEFFADDPKMATKNLRSDMVEKVQVVERKSETARLTGVDDGEDETVINLTVKKGMNNGWFGTIGGGYGTDDRYQGSAVINYFNNGNQFSIVAGGNNINEMGFTDRGRGRFRDFGGNKGINSTQHFGINFNVGNEEKFRIGGNVAYSHSDRIARSRFDKQYLFPDSVSYQHGGSNTRDRGHSIIGQFRMQWNISEADVLDFRPEFNVNIRRSELQDSATLLATLSERDRVNRNLTLKNNRGLDYSTSGRLIYTHKFLSRPGRSVSAQFNYSFSNTRQKQTSWNDIEYFLTHDDSERLFQYLDSRQWSNNVEGRLTWTEPLGDPTRGNSLEIAYKASLKFNNADKLTYDLPADDYDVIKLGLPDYDRVPSDGVFNPNLSNRFRNRFTNQELQLGFKKNAEKYNLNVGMTFSPSSSSSEDLINSDRNIDTRWVWNVAPYMRFRYRFSKQSSLMAHYRARTSQPSMTQLQPVADKSDPLNIVVGNPDLKPTFTQSLGFHYNNYNTDTQQSIFAVANASFALNNVVSRTITDPETGVRTTTYANSNGNWNVFVMAMLNQPLRNKSWRITARLNTNYSSTAGYINGEFNRSGNLILAPTAGMTFSSDIFQMSLSPTYSFGMSTSTLARQNNRYTNSYGFNTDASLYLPFGLEVGTDLAFSKSTGYSQGFDNTQWLWNAQLSYSVLSDKSLTFTIKAYDLLGQKKNVSRSVSASLISDTEYNDLRRYVMIGVTWKFNSFKKKGKDTPQSDFGMSGAPPGAPDGSAPKGRPQGMPPGPPPGGGMH